MCICTSPPLIFVQILTQSCPNFVDNNIAPVYYDLGGRVVNAEQMGKGIYIKRIGNKSEKVLVR